jgi:hypothetical protein
MFFYLFKNTKTNIIDIVKISIKKIQFNIGVQLLNIVSQWVSANKINAAGPCCV